MWLEIGCWLIGFAFGYATGLSKTPGTTWKVLGIVSGLVGGIAAWIERGEHMGIFLTCLAIGFSLGISLGAKLRRNGVWDVSCVCVRGKGKGVAEFMHNQASVWFVALIQTSYIGLPSGVLFINIITLIAKLLCMVFH